MRGMFGRAEKRGVLIGVWDEQEIAPELWKHYWEVTACDRAVSYLRACGSTRDCACVSFGQFRRGPGSAADPHRLSISGRGAGDAMIRLLAERIQSGLGRSWSWTIAAAAPAASACKQ